MREIIYKLAIILLIAVMLISSYFIFINEKEDKEQEIIYNEITEIAQEKQENQKNDINMKSLYEINNDIVGWIKIENTQIDFPIMQTIDRPNYYLQKNFYNKYSQWGTPFMAENCNIETSDNLIIYGHHIKNYKMFGELEKYRDRDFYNNHKNIIFYTLSEKQTYEISYIFRAIAGGDFKYYNFIKANNQREFETFSNKCKELSFYPIENEAKYGDKLITLSTCDYTVKNGRLVVVARRI